VLAERLAEGRGSATVATAENDRVPKPCPMPREPRYLQRLVRPALAKRSDDVWIALPWEHSRTECKYLVIMYSAIHKTNPIWVNLIIY
jgi:hypothetical protein